MLDKAQAAAKERVLRGKGDTNIAEVVFLRRTRRNHFSSAAPHGGDVRYFGEIDTTEAATRKLVAKLAAQYR